MPAGLNFRSILFTTLPLVTLLLGACSRDNPLSIPEKYIEEPATFCIEGGPYSDLTLLSSIAITNTIETLPETYPQDANNTVLDLTVPYLINHSTITPEEIPESTDNSGSEGPVTKQLVTQKVVKNTIEEYLSLANLSFIENHDPEVTSLNVAIDYPKDGVNSNQQIEEDEITFVSADLEDGLNTVTIKVSASVEVPRTSIDCTNPLTTAELASESFTENDRYQVISFDQTFIVNLERKDLSGFTQTELTSILSNSQDDELGKVLSVDNEFLVLGVPNEDSLAQGIYEAERFTTSDLDLLFAQNENSSNSGAVYVYQKSVDDTWVFHSFIKSSNNETDDLFGSSVALYDGKLVVSAPGEDSIGSGVLLSSDPQTENSKLNNSASSSGAVYLFEFNASTSRWSEKYYIKPENNVVSGANYNKGFGTQVAMHKNKILISAPLEDSDNGIASNSNQPNSGAVYVYNTANGLDYSGTLKAFNPGENDKFGSSIALNDSFFIVGAPFEDQENRSITNKLQNVESETLDDNNREDSGSVYVFKHSLTSNTSSISAHIKPSNADMLDFFGSSIAISGNNLFVGSVGEDSSGQGLNRDSDKNDSIDSGAVYRFSYSELNDTWVEGTYIKANDSQSTSSFGKYLAANAEHLFISAPFFDTATEANAGKLYFYRLTDTELTQEFLFQEQGSTSEMNFGSTIAIGGSNLAVGASGYINDETGVGIPSVGQVFTYE